MLGNNNSNPPACLANNSVVSSAFPTVSGSELPTKSFFDLAGDAIIITSTAAYAIYPLAERKKSKTGFVVVHPTLFEIHKTQKDFKAKKLAKYFIDFADVFNVSIQHEPIQLKSDCIAILEPAETYMFKPIDSEYPLEAWFNWILEKARECRSNKLVRPVFREEYFEASWDVSVVKKPKLRKEYNKQEGVDDLVLKRPTMEGRKRLCICSTSFLLFEMEAKPTYNVDAPFDKQAFIDLPLNVISNYGCQEKYFFIRIGRCSEIGSGELWMSSESGPSAKAMHEKISAINLRESDRRRTQGIKISVPTISSRVLKSRAHRERSQTANQQLQKSDSQARLRIGTGALNQQQLVETSEKQRKSSSNSITSLLTPVSSSISLSTMPNKDNKQQCTDTSGQRVPLNGNGSLYNANRLDSATCLSSIPEKVREEMGSSNQSVQSKKNSIAGLLPFRLGRLSNASVCSSSAEPLLHSPSTSGGVQHPLEGLSPTSSSVMQRLSGSNRHTKGCSSANKHQLGVNKTGSGSTVESRLDRISQLSVDGALSQQYDCADDYMTYDASDSLNHLSNFNKANLGADESRKSSATNSGIVMHQMPMRQYSMGSSSIAPSDSHQRMSAVAGGGTSSLRDYLEMDENTLSSNAYRPEMVFPLQEVRSYISNSTESCWSPYSSEGASNVPRAYSLGSKPTAAKVMAQRQKELDELENHNRALSSNSVTLPPGCTSAGLQPYSPPRIRPTTTPDSSYSQLNQDQQLPLHVLAPRDGGDYVLASVKPPVSQMDSAAIVNWRGGVQHAANSGGNNSHATTSLDSEDMRKRAHSVGSKSWMKQPSSLRKMSGKRNAAIAAADIPRNSENPPSAVDSSETRDRADSTGSRASSIFSGGGSNFEGNSRRNTNRSLASHPDQDHVEIDFDRDGSCASIESPMNRSRNSSIGVQLPTSVRSALDLALSSAHHHLHRPANFMGEKPSEKFIKDEGENNRNPSMMVRKRSVPEMNTTGQDSPQPAGSPSPGQPNNHAQQTSRRRSTFDCSLAATSMARFRAKANTNHHLLSLLTPPCASSTGSNNSSSKPMNRDVRFGSTSLSTSSGISSRCSEPSISALTSNLQGLGLAGVVQQLSGQHNSTGSVSITTAGGEEEDEYVLMDTTEGSGRSEFIGQMGAEAMEKPRKTKTTAGNQQQQTRVISTILESANSSSSASSSVGSSDSAANLLSSSDQESDEEVDEGTMNPAASSSVHSTIGLGVLQRSGEMPMFPFQLTSMVSGKRPAKEGVVKKMTHSNETGRCNERNVISLNAQESFWEEEDDNDPESDYGMIVVSNPPKPSTSTPRQIPNSINHCQPEPKPCFIPQQRLPTACINLNNVLVARSGGEIPLLDAKNSPGKSTPRKPSSAASCKAFRIEDGGAGYTESELNSAMTRKLTYGCQQQPMIGSQFRSPQQSVSRRQRQQSTASGNEEVSQQQQQCDYTMVEPTPTEK